ncbi:MAG: hypothetical protein LUD15_04980 [Bacteroides sp.]|nr:hypothetical protein [Bacteroides sp.]
MKRTLSIQLLEILRNGIGQLGKEALDRVKEYVVSSQTSGGAFTDKSGKEDLYYTLFGLMLAYLTGLPVDSRRTAQYLDSVDTEALDLIHYAAWIRCRNLLTLIRRGKAGALLTLFRKVEIPPLRSFKMLLNGDPFSPYTRFIWYSLLEDTRHSVGRSATWLQDLQPYRVSTGGYANRKGAGTATVNATAAALSVTGQLTGYKSNNDIVYLREIQDPSGGYKATPHTPVPDLLSTATALFTLRNYNMEPAVVPLDFIEAHWLDSGGFAPTLLENSSDMEYTFYGLLALGACS